MSLDLTVVIPNFNCEPFLQRCLDSVLSQLPESAEILVVDDGSTDGSREWLLAKKAVCPQLRLYFQENLGVVEARNAAITQAKGTWVAFLDADDFWYENKIKHQLDTMRSNKKCVLSFTNYVHLTEEYEPIIDCFNYWSEARLHREPKEHFFLLDDPVNKLLSNNVVGTSSVMVRRDAFDKAGKFDNSLKSASDWDMWLRLASVGEVAYCNAPFMGYVMRKNSITSNKVNRISAMQTIIDKTKLRASVRRSSVRAAESKIKEGMAEIYRGERRYFYASLNTLVSLCKSPNLRNLKCLCFDMYKCVQIRGVSID